MNDQIAALKQKFDEDMAAINGNLSNISTDITNLNTQIQDLNAKVQAGNPLTPEDLAAFASIASGMDTLATTTKSLADRTPDVPEAPVIT